MSVELGQFEGKSRTVGTVAEHGVPSCRPARRRRVGWLIGLACAAYLLPLPVLLALEDRLLFPGATVARSYLEPPGYLRVQELTLESARGDRIHAWFCVPDGWRPERGAVVVSHGNGSNLSRESGRAYRWQQALDRAVVLYDYPGYGKSTGRPSEDGCYAAGDAVVRWLCDRQGVPVGEVLVVGESLGGAVAVELAVRHPVRMLVLEGAFTSFPDMAQIRVPCYPARYLVHNRMENEAKIARVRCPVLITHGTADSVVPFSQGERLFAAAHEPKEFVPLEGHGHGPPNTAEFFQMVRAILSER